MPAFKPQNNSRMGEWKTVLSYVVLAAVVVVAVTAQPLTAGAGAGASSGRERHTRAGEREELLGELLRESLRKTAASRLARQRQLQQQDQNLSAPASSAQFNDMDLFQRIRKQAAPAVRCGGGSGRNPYECNDGLMGVWLRLMKNPDYSD